MVVFLDPLGLVKRDVEVGTLRRFGLSPIGNGIAKVERILLVSNLGVRFPVLVGIVATM